MRGNAKLKVVEEGTAKELPFGLFDKIHEIQAKQQFMAVAIPALWDGRQHTHKHNCIWLSYHNG